MNKLVSIALILSVVIINACENKKENEATGGDKIATSTFKVWGNCGMCKKTIEGSLEVEGVYEADWSTETKMIMVSYQTNKISLDQIQKNIAAVGYDNENYKGNDEAYNNLPECCQYIRKK